MTQYLIPSKKSNIKINVLEGLNIPDPKACILNIHGIGSHFQPIYPSLDEFDSRDDYFNKFGYKSFAFEFHGHGKSEGLRCSINNFNDLVNDIISVISHIRSLHKDIKIFLCAESMGGAVVLKYIVDSYTISDNFICGIILYSPLCGVDDRLKPNPLIIQLLLAASYILPQRQLALTKIDTATLASRNQAYKDAKKQCKFSFNGPHRLCTVRELYNICLWIPKNVHKITTPILIFHGLQDKITVPGETVKIYHAISSVNKKLVLLPDSEHILLVPESSDDLTPNLIFTQMHTWMDLCVCKQLTLADETDSMLDIISINETDNVNIDETNNVNDYDSMPDLIPIDESDLTDNDSMPDLIPIDESDLTDNDYRPAVEPVVESAVEPVVESAVEPVVKSAVEPVVESAVEPVVESAVEPVVKSAVEPVVKSAVESPVKSAVKSVVKSVVKLPVKSSVVLSNNSKKVQSKKVQNNADDDADDEADNNYDINHIRSNKFI